MLSLGKIALVPFVFGAGLAHAQNVTTSSPLPIFDLESGAPVLESIIEPDSLQGIDSIRGSDIYEMAKIVARVEYPDHNGFCTSFRVGDSLFLTNFHCWQAGGENVFFHMGYETNNPEDQQLTYKATAMLLTYEKLDFALYRVESMDPASPLQFPIATLTKKPRVLNMPLLVPGHPGALPKEVDLSDQCRLTRVEPYDYYNRLNIQHQCDTMGGSSGSPLLDKSTGHVLGLHWGAASGTGSNHAIPMDLILEYIAQQLPDVYPELTVEE